MNPIFPLIYRGETMSVDKFLLPEGAYDSFILSPDTVVREKLECGIGPTAHPRLYQRTASVLE